jgi:hypothetical protein
VPLALALMPDCVLPEVTELPVPVAELPVPLALLPVVPAVLPAVEPVAPLLPSIVPRISTRELTFFCRSFSWPTSVKLLPALSADWLDGDWFAVIEPDVPAVAPVDADPAVDPLVVAPTDDPAAALG